MNFLRRIYRLMNILSIDVAAGAMISSLWFEKILGSGYRPYAIASLGLTVWIIYTADHLSDARHLNTAASTERHRFHQAYGRLLLIAMIFAVAAVMVLVFFIRSSVLYGGLYLSALILIYLFIQSRLRAFKEPTGAVLYCAGVLVPSLPIADGNLTPFAMMLIILFSAIVLTNLVLFSWCDYRHDQADHRSSIITVAGLRAGKILLILLFCFQAFIITMLFVTAVSILPVAVVTGMSTMLFVIFLSPDWFSVNDRYRFAGDSIFIFPLICLFVR